MRKWVPRLDIRGAYPISYIKCKQLVKYTKYLTWVEIRKNASGVIFQKFMTLKCNTKCFVLFP